VRERERESVRERERFVCVCRHGKPFDHVHRGLQVENGTIRVSVSPLPRRSGCLRLLHWNVFVSCCCCCWPGCCCCSWPDCWPSCCLALTPPPPTHTQRVLILHGQLRACTRMKCFQNSPICCGFVVVFVFVLLLFCFRTRDLVQP